MNRGNAIGELGLCVEHLWLLDMEPLAATVRRIRVAVQFRKDPAALWKSAWTMLSAAVTAEIDILAAREASAAP